MKMKLDSQVCREREREREGTYSLTESEGEERRMEGSVARRGKR